MSAIKLNVFFNHLNSYCYRFNNLTLFISLSLSILSLSISLSLYIYIYIYSPFGWGCRIHRLHLCRGLRSPSTSVLIYDIKQSDGEVPVMQEIWGMWSTLSLPSFPGPLWPGVVAHESILSMSQIELNCVLMLN